MTKKVFSFTDFALSEGDRCALKQPLGATMVATESKNCRCVKGALKRCLGLEYIYDYDGKKLYAEPIAQKIKLMYYDDTTTYDRHYMGAMIADDGYLYGYSESLRAFERMDKMPGRESALCPLPFENGQKDFYLASKATLHRINNCISSQAAIKNRNHYALCVFHDRVFFSSNRGVRYSEAGDFDNFSSSAYGGGKIDIWEGEGGILQLVVYQDTILLFKRNTVLRFYAAGAADEFRVEPMDYRGSRIVRNSAARCGRYVLFLTEGGEIYRLDGNRFEKLTEGVPTDFCFDNVNAAADGERYFLSDEKKVLVVEAEDGSKHYSYQVYGLTDNDGTVVVEKDHYICRMVEKGFLPRDATAQFVAKNVAVKDEKEKLVRKLILYGSGGVELSFGAGRYEMKMLVPLSEQGVEVLAGVKGKTFDFSIVFKGYANVRKIDVEYNELGGEK